jgi:hypothetical protein
MPELLCRDLIVAGLAQVACVAVLVSAAECERGDVIHDLGGSSYALL